MDTEKLKNHLFAGGTRLFCVLDGASVPDLPVKLYEMGPANHCLLPGDLEPELVYAAPYLVHLAPETEFTEWVFAGAPGNHWGIFVHSAVSMLEMRKHFRGLINVCNDKGDPMMFRYYDPRVLRKFLPTCTPDEMNTFFGRTDAFFAESADGKGMTRFQIDEDALKQTELN
ncbi:MAG: DUF4123 domain-containing protein [Acidobacteriota bacterium]